MWNKQNPKQYRVVKKTDTETNTHKHTVYRYCITPLHGLSVIVTVVTWGRRGGPRCSVVSVHVFLINKLNTGTKQYSTVWPKHSHRNKHPQLKSETQAT